MKDVSELNDTEITHRMRVQEKLILKIQDELAIARSGSERATFYIKQYHLTLMTYADTIVEAGKRKIITLH